MDLVLQRRLFAVAGAIVSFMAVALAYYAPASVMHRNIGAVAPILRDNFWLAVHVVTIMASYASAAIALILGNIALGYYLLGHYVVSAAERTGRHAAWTSKTYAAWRPATTVIARPPEICASWPASSIRQSRSRCCCLAAGTILGACGPTRPGAAFGPGTPRKSGR